MGWDLKAIQEWERVEKNKVEKDLWRREKDRQGQIEEGKIRKAKYNEMYKELIIEGKGSRYLEKEINQDSIGMRIRTLTRLRCMNMEEDKKYWLGEGKRICFQDILL